MVDVTSSGTSERVAPQVLSNKATKPAASRSDIGTVFIHWTTAIATMVCIATGLRIAADALNARISAFLAPILPQGEIWTVHFIAGLVLFLGSTAYFLYVKRSGLSRRSALKRTVVLTMPVAARLKWAAVNVVLHWALYALITIMTATGILLYLGFGGLVVRIHTITAFAVIGYIVLHLVAHYNYGGLDQILRIFRPATLVRNNSVRPMPLIAAIAAGLVVAAAIATADWSSRDVLTVRSVSGAPQFDGRLDEPFWSGIPSVTVRTHQGESLGGSGTSTVEIRAAHDDDHVYFAFRWNDATRSAWRMPLIKKEDGWHVLQDDAAHEDVNTFYEDKFAVAFARNWEYGGSDSTHLGRKPLADKPASVHGRGLHYTTDGSYMDVWQWKSTRGGLLGMLDDMAFGPPVEPNEAHWAGTSRYKAGYVSDPGRPAYEMNYKTRSPGVGGAGYDEPVDVPRLPKDLAATQAAMGPFEIDPDFSLADGARWWLTEKDSIPYTPEADARIPVGTVIPGLLITGRFEGDRADVTGAARWADGFWTLETKRKLKSDSQFDVSFGTGEPLYMWVSVFDHTQIRHTRHQRPVRLDFQ